MTTLFITHPDCDAHVTPFGHPEQVARLEYIRAALEPVEGLMRKEAPLCADADILRCHPQHYLDKVSAAIPKDGWVSLDGDTHVTTGSEIAARRAVGGALRAVDAVLDEEAQNAFVACRPPGHHAETDTAMGFCLFGNVSIAAKHALDARGLSRVAVIDFDVHHGNGTQDLLWDEPRAMFVSSHQMPLYPGSGAAHERGAHGQILNIPLSGNSDGAAMRSVYEQAVFPAVRKFAPELIIVSAGFDAHAADPLANLNWRTEDFVWLTREICNLADEVCQGRVVACLEGGYDLEALAASVKGMITEMMTR